MALPREYVTEDCPIARALEIIGERWTLLIVRDAFYGVSRFSDFRDHLLIPRAVLSERLNLLTEHGILARATAASGRDEYALTAKGEALWPALWSLMQWGNDYYTVTERCRRYTHADCGGEMRPDGTCAACGIMPPPRDLTVHPRAMIPGAKTDQVSQALMVPHRLLTPLTGVPV